MLITCSIYSNKHPVAYYFFYFLNGPLLLKIILNNIKSFDALKKNTKYFHGFCAFVYGTKQNPGNAGN